MNDVPRRVSRQSHTDTHVPESPYPGGHAVDLDERLAFLRLEAIDAERLRELKPVFARHLDEFVEAFYEHLSEFESTRRLLRDPALVERLKLAQREHFL